MTVTATDAQRKRLGRVIRIMLWTENRLPET